MHPLSSSSARSTQAANSPGRHDAARKSTNIPYSYVASFRLEGRRGNRVQDVVNVSLEGTFVAVSIGYSFLPARLPAQPVVVNAGGRTPGALTALRSLLEPYTQDQPQLAQCLVRKLCGIDFKYSIVDSGSGRELQNLPVHNLAGLGEAGGERPFQQLAQPMVFSPRSTIRIEIEEISEGTLYGYDDQASGRRVGAELSMVLHGYKMLGHGTGLDR